MLNRRLTLLIAVLIAAGGFTYGLYRLFDLRFASGDVYPPYSTFRADPLGARAWFESLGLVGGVETRRLLEPLRTAGSGAGTTLFVLGTGVTDLREVSQREVDEIEQFMNQGGRVVIAFYPETSTPFFNFTNSLATTNTAPGSKSKRRRRPASSPTVTNAPSGSLTNAPGPMGPPLKTPPTTFGPKFISLEERWDFDMEFRRLELNDDRVAQPARVTNVVEIAGLPRALDWRSSTVFVTSNAAWTAVLQRSNAPVLMERRFGKGSLVLMSDSYFTSNEAMRQSRQTALLTWLIGGGRRLLFDETHLGVEVQPGVATLARRYRLHGLFASLLLLAGLFVWRNSVSFVPPHPSLAGGDGDVTGKDSASGFINLLRRSLAPRALLRMCFDEWQQSVAKGRPELGPKIARMAGVVENNEAKPVDAYRELSRIVSERNL